MEGFILDHRVMEVYNGLVISSRLQSSSLHLKLQGGGKLDLSNKIHIVTQITDQFFKIAGWPKDTTFKNSVSHFLFVSGPYNVAKLQKDIQTINKSVKHHEDGITNLKTYESRLDESIREMQNILAKYYLDVVYSNEGAAVVSDEWSEAETIKQILKYEKSAAALLYRLKTQHEITQPMTLILKDIEGVVAMLGKVDDHNLSRILSEFLAIAMLAVVCRTYEGVKALEANNGDGSVCYDFGLHGLGASIGTPLAGRFTAICLEKLRPYAGAFDVTQTLRRLDLHKPRLPSGELPPGFLGFAVNMIQVDESSDLRETLFYNLFSHLQVYSTSKEMKNAQPLISHGAVSLDGGIIATNGNFRLGTLNDLDVVFPVTSKGRYKPVEYAEIEERLKEKELKKQWVLEELRHEESKLMYVKFNLEIKKEFMQFLGLEA